MFLKFNGKYILSILLTNWIHLLGFYMATYFSLILFKLFGLEGAENESWSETLLTSILAIPLLFMLYGPIIIGGFYTAILVLDIVGFNLKSTNTLLILILQWIIISAPFVMWASEYEYWLWLALIMSFLITQLIRKKKIEKIKTRYNNGQSQP